MAEFKAKVKQIIEQGFTNEQIRPEFNRIKKGYYKNEIKQEKKETFDIDISMKGLKGRIQPKDQVIDQQKAKTYTNTFEKYRSKPLTKPVMSEIEIREIPITTTASKPQHSSQTSTKKNLYKDIINSLDVNKVRNCYKSKVKREIELFCKQETTSNSHQKLLPSVPNMNDNHNTNLNSKQIQMHTNQSFNLLNHKISCILNKTNSLTKTANRGVFQINNNNNSRSLMWTKVTSINLDNDNQKDVNDFSKSFDIKLSSKERGQFLSKMDSMFNSRLRKRSEDNLRERLILDF